MKRIFVAVLIFLTATAFPKTAASAESTEQDTPSESDSFSADMEGEEDDAFADFDSLFDAAEDIIASEEEEKTVLQATTPPKERQVLTFYGSFSAKALYSRQIIGNNEDKNYPAASLSYTLGGTLRPSDTLTGHFSVATSFPNFSLALSSLYFDYDVFGKAYITAGYTAFSWGNTSIFGTNLLNTNAHILALLTVPFGRGQFEASAHLDNPKAISSQEPLRHLFYYAASIEYPFKGVLYKAFARTWPDGTNNTHSAAAGLELTGDIYGIHFTLHEDIQSATGTYTEFNRNTFVAGISKWQTSPEKIGALIEYQFVYDKSKEQKHNHAIALEATWRHILGSRYTVSLYSSYSLTNKNAVAVPALSISGLPHASVNFALPVLIGEGASWTLSDGTGYAIKDTGSDDYSLENLSEKLAVFFSCGISLSFSH